jgi:cytochrome c553
VVLALAASPARSATLEERLAPCLACHGDKGQSSLPEVPSLGGQPEFYLSVQLFMFRENMRSAEPMNAMMKGVNDGDLQRMAAALSKLPAPPPAVGAPDRNRVERARALIQQHRCNFCHNEDFSGEKNAPRLTGQREDYLVKALRDYKDNTRRAYDTSMADAVYPLTDADIQDLAHYLARFNPNSAVESERGANLKQRRHPGVQVQSLFLLLAQGPHDLRP